MDLQEAWESFLEAWQDEIDSLNASGDEQDAALAKLADALFEKHMDSGLADLVDVMKYESDAALEQLKRWGMK